MAAGFLRWAVRLKSLSDNWRLRRSAARIPASRAMHSCLRGIDWLWAGGLAGRCHPAKAGAQDSHFRNSAAASRALSNNGFHPDP